MDHNTWFQQFRESAEYAKLKQRPVAYFCAEFALTENAPTYAGGLGILAADMINEAADQKLPLVAVGLFYHEGYLHHELTAEGTELVYPPRRRPEEFGLTKVMGANNQPLTISIPLQGRHVSIVAWEKRIGETVTMYFLDTDVAENAQDDKAITNRLYVANKETRFKQEMVLGIGGLRLLSALKIHPLIYHLNEGHSALLSLEVSHHEMDEYKKSFMEELQRAKQHIVFTNHTLIAAGNDMFNNDMVTALLNDYSQQVRVPVQDLVNFGLVHESSIFSMTMLALRMANKINAVSVLHAEKAKDIWQDHPMSAVTNGIHIRTWDRLESGRVAKLQRGKDETEKTEKNNSGSLPAGRQVWNSETFWQAHQENKRALLGMIKEQTGEEWKDNELLVGWGRRIVGYKRPLALFHDKERLKQILANNDRPLRIVMAGSAHESDEEGAAMLAQLQQLIKHDFPGKVVYLPNYSATVAKALIAGCDVWLNTPVVGFEACGTSGMKAALNGCLPVSTKDGWVYEVETFGNGWIIDNDRLTESLLSTIEEQILPLYYQRSDSGLSEGWIQHMRNARDMIIHQYSTTRMLREYIEKMYVPVIEMLQK
jgi:alpha-glucan phosphorylase-like protein